MVLGVPLFSRNRSFVMGLAPMEGVTDFATRQWFQWVGGMDYVSTPFLRVTDSFPGKIAPNFAPELSESLPHQKIPTILQVMGSSPYDVIRTHDLYGDLVPFVDLNCGCPSPTVVGNKAGSSLLENPVEFRRFLEIITRSIGPGRLSVKMRTGFHDPKEFETLLSALKDLPLHHLTVHGRTRAQKYTGYADWDLIQRASETVTFPVIGSGDLCSREQVLKVREQFPKLSGVIIGRGALRNPWLWVSEDPVPLLNAWILFVLLQDLQGANYEGLVEFFKEGSLSQYHEIDERSLMQIIGKIARFRGSALGAFSNLDVRPRAFARGKMLWNYLRSSVKSELRDPRLLRAQTIKEFIQVFTEICQKEGFHPNELRLTYDPSLDWMYSGAGKGS